MQINIIHGDITQRPVEAIVNAANPSLMGGGGVDGAIHRAVGPFLKETCRRFPATAEGIRCPIGEIRSTVAAVIPAKYIIHAVGPIFPMGRSPCFPGEYRWPQEHAETLLAIAIRNCLLEAQRLQIRSIAFSAISCGFYGCPIEVFARRFKATLAEKDWDLDLVELILFREEDYQRYLAVE